MYRIPAIEDYLKTPPNPTRQEGGCRPATKQECDSEQPLVTVITVVVNRNETLPRTIISVLGQSYPNIEYIVVDGASTDGTLEVIKQFDNKIDLWISEPDHGPADAFNKAISLARGDIIFGLSSDDWIEPDFIEVAVKTTLNSDADFVFGKVKIYTNGVLDFILEGDKDYTKSITSRKTNLNFPCWVIKRKCFDKVGLLDLRYKICCDYEWALRLHLLGGRGVYESRLIMHFAGGGVSDTNIFQMVLEELKALRQHGLPITRALVAILYSFMRRMLGKLAKLFLPHTVYQKLMRVVRKRYSAPSATSAFSPEQP
jgi:glycosyltransferase involved in cell wall biosynthesis